MKSTDPRGASLPDVNVLIAAMHPSHQFHRAALAWLDSDVRFATTAITETGFLRLSVNPNITSDQVTVRDALDVLRTLRSDDHWTFWPDTTSLADPRIDTVAMIGGKQITDFHLVNLAAVYDGQLVTFDTRITGALHPRDRHRVHVLVP